MGLGVQRTGPRSSEGGPWTAASASPRKWVSVLLKHIRARAHTHTHPQKKKIRVKSPCVVLEKQRHGSGKMA